MSDMTWFGWAYLAATAVGVLGKIWLIGRPRDPVDHTEAVLHVVISVSYTWALFTVGVRA